jgi:hypothetical protein
MTRLTKWTIARARKTPYTHLVGYMERYWLFNSYYAPNYRAWLPSIRVHHILRSDLDRAHHNHPWAFVSILLEGEYKEERHVYRHGYYVGTSLKRYGAGSILFRRHTDAHKLELPEGTTTWTLFITFRKRHHWGFVKSPFRPSEITPHNEYLNGDD